MKKLFLLISLFSFQLLVATDVDLSPSIDSYIDQNGPTTNYGSATDFIVYPRVGSTASRRIVIKFDLSSIPAGSVINSATLKLTETGTYGATRTIAVHRLRTSWSEGTVTWNSPWTSNGGNYNSTATTTSTISWTGLLKQDTWSITSDVDSLVNKGATNYGWILKDNSEDNTQEYWQYATKEHGTSSSRPILSINYTPALPVNLLDFNAFLQNNVVHTSWTTASEINNDYFTVERSIDGEHFFPVQIVKGQGNSNIINFYAWDDTNLPNVDYLYYRLRQTDNDGQFEIFDIVVVPMNPNVSDDFYYFDHKVFLPKNFAFPASLIITDDQGKEMFRMNIANQTYEIDVPYYLADAVYFIVLANKQNRYSKKILIR